MAAGRVRAVAEVAEVAPEGPGEEDQEDHQLVAAVLLLLLLLLLLLQNLLACYPMLLLRLPLHPMVPAVAGKMRARLQAMDVQQQQQQ